MNELNMFSIVGGLMLIYFLLGIFIGPIGTVLLRKFNFSINNTYEPAMLTLFWPFTITMCFFVVTVVLFNKVVTKLIGKVNSFVLFIESIVNDFSFLGMIRFVFRFISSIVLVSSLMYVSILYSLVYSDRVTPYFVWLLEMLN